MVAGAPQPDPRADHIIESEEAGRWGWTARRAPAKNPLYPSGERVGEGADSRALADTHLTLRRSATGPSLSP